MEGNTLKLKYEYYGEVTFTFFIYFTVFCNIYKNMNFVIKKIKFRLHRKST